MLQSDGHATSDEFTSVVTSPERIRECRRQIDDGGPVEPHELS